jgi:hypothetical protein
MFAHNFVETGYLQQRSIVKTTAGEIRPGGGSVSECENAAASDRGYRIDSVAVPGSV